MAHINPPILTITLNANRLNTDKKAVSFRLFKVRSSCIFFFFLQETHLRVKEFETK